MVGNDRFIILWLFYLDFFKVVVLGKEILDIK